MPDGTFELRIHNRVENQGSPLGYLEGLTGIEAVRVMKLCPNVTFTLHQHGQPTEADQDALRRFQAETGKHLAHF